MRPRNIRNGSIPERATSGKPLEIRPCCVGATVKNLSARAPMVLIETIPPLPQWDADQLAFEASEGYWADRIMAEPNS